MYYNYSTEKRANNNRVIHFDFSDNRTQMLTTTRMFYLPTDISKTDLELNSNNKETDYV